MATKNEKLNSLLERLEKQVERLEKIKVVGGASKGGSAAGGDDELPAYIEAYNEYYNDNVAGFVKLSRDFGDDYNALADLTIKSFKQLKTVLIMGSKSKKPNMDKMKELVFLPINAIIKEWDDLRFKSKGKDTYNHYSTMMEAMKCIQWVGIRDTPFKWVKETHDQACFWSNKVLSVFRKKDERHVDWVNKMKKMVMELHNYVKEHHMTGMRWNPKGKEAALGEDDDSDSDDDEPMGPPPMDDLDLSMPAKPVQSTGGKPNTGGLFDEISKGGFKLKKVTRDMKTKYRKPEDKISKVPSKIEKKGVTKKKKAKKERVRTPKFEFDGGKKWSIEYQMDNHTINVKEEEVKNSHAFYVLGCQNSTIVINGKVNSIFIDKCKKSKILVGSLVASLEIVNCESVQIQVNGKAPIVSIDNTAGCELYIAKPSYDADIILSKCSEINLCPMKEGDYDEFPCPEQILVKYNKETKKPTFRVKREDE